MPFKEFEVSILGKTSAQPLPELLPVMCTVILQFYKATAFLDRNRLFEGASVTIFF